MDAVIVTERDTVEDRDRGEVGVIDSVPITRDSNEETEGEGDKELVSEECTEEVITMEPEESMLSVLVSVDNPVGEESTLRELILVASPERVALREGKASDVVLPKFDTVPRALEELPTDEDDSWEEDGVLEGSKEKVDTPEGDE